MINLYEGRCDSCAVWVSGGEGRAVAEDGKWLVLCATCASDLGVNTTTHVKGFQQLCPACGLMKNRHLFSHGVCVDCA